MKKILIACRAYYPDIAGGGEISTKTLAENLAKKGYDVNVVAISSEAGKDDIDNITVYRIKFENLYWSFNNKNTGKIKKLAWHVIDSNNIFFKKTLSDILSKLEPEVLITSTIEDISSIIWKVAKSKGIRTVHILRSYSLLCANANMFKTENCKNRCKFCSIITQGKKANSKYVDDVVGISQFVLDEHLKYNYFPNSRRHVIYNICLDKKNTAIPTKTNLDNIKIGYLGRVHVTKGIDLIMDALSCLSYDLKNRVEVLVAGNGDEIYIQELKNTAKRLDISVNFLGSMNATKFLDSIDILVVPSKWNEPFGRVVIESIGRNVPVIAKSVGGIPELLLNNKDFLFNCPKDLSKIISKFLNREIFFDFNLERFNSDCIIDDWQKLLENEKD
ncbi:glycosyltransferase [Erwiniaceae bacterium CAU 1747]